MSQCALLPCCLKLTAYRGLKVFQCAELKWSSLVSELQRDNVSWTIGSNLSCADCHNNLPIISSGYVISERNHDF